MAQLILPLTKGPQDRVGPRTRQDWYCGLIKAHELLQADPSAKILVISNVHVAGRPHEATVYAEALQEFGVSNGDVVVIRQAQETIEQLHLAAGIAQKLKKELVIISTWLHYPRVRWICWWDGIAATHHAAFGIPRPGEAIRDVALWVIFPLVDLFGKRELFLKKVEERRLKGVH